MFLISDFHPKTKISVYMSCVTTERNSGDQTKEWDMRVACSKYREVKYIQVPGRENRRKETTWKTKTYMGE